MTTPKVRSLRASVHGFYSKDGFFNFKGSGTYLIRHPLMRRFKFAYLPTTGYTLFAYPTTSSLAAPTSYMRGGHVIWKI
jgi:hypothetical protein